MILRLLALLLIAPQFTPMGGNVSPHTGGGSGTFSLTQVKSNNSCSGTTCTITVTSTGAGHSAVIGIMASVSTTISSATGCSTAWTVQANTAAGNSTTGFTSMAYCLSLTGGSTTIVLTNSNNSWNGPGIFWETSSTTTASFDVSNSNLQSCTTSCTGTALTLAGANDAIFTIASCGGTCSAVTTYTADLSFPSGDGVAHLLNTVSGSAPTWTQTSSTALTSAAIALKD